MQIKNKGEQMNKTLDIIAIKRELEDLALDMERTADYHRKKFEEVHTSLINTKQRLIELLRVVTE